MSSESPHILDYLRLGPEDRAKINVAAVLSISAALTGLVFMFTVFAGVWKLLVPGLNPVAGYIVLGLSICSVIWGAVGALRAPRESGWYGASLIGYALGMFVGTLSPILFMI